MSSEILTSPFVASWLAKARKGTLTQPDHKQRTGAWAQWAPENISKMSGHSDRSYYALLLPGSFYDPNNTAVPTRPHLEIPTGLWYSEDYLFPDRLALTGNGLLFPSWLFSEVLATKRALLSPPRGDITALIKLLVEYREDILTAALTARKALKQNWNSVETSLISTPQNLTDKIIPGFSTTEIAKLFPQAKNLKLSVQYDQKLATFSKDKTSRRIGIWQLKGVCNNEPFTQAVITPRLTKSSLFNDPLFTPSTESVASLLVQALLHAKLASLEFYPIKAIKPVVKPRLRAIPARAGEKMPQASLEAASRFIQTYPDAALAWETLTTWAAKRTSGTETILTITEPNFKKAHKNVAKALRTAQTPDRTDVNVLLPLAWENRTRVVRVTYAS